MRAFIAISLPQEIKAVLANFQKELKKSQADVKWVEEKNIHLTLKFLGEIDDSLTEKISVILEDTTKELSPFSLRLNSAGAFPGVNSPRVIWVGLTQENEQLNKIAGTLEKKLVEVGLPPEEKPFTSHITIARVRSNKNRQGLTKSLITLQNYFNEEPYKWQVDSITLFKSTLTPQGPIYAPLKEASFKTS